MCATLTSSGKILEAAISAAIYLIGYSYDVKAVGRRFSVPTTH